MTDPDPHIPQAELDSLRDSGDQPRLRKALEAAYAESVADKARIAELEKGLREAEIPNSVAYGYEFVNRHNAHIDALLKEDKS